MLILSLIDIGQYNFRRFRELFNRNEHEMRFHVSKELFTEVFLLLFIAVDKLRQGFRSEDYFIIVRNFRDHVFNFLVF